MKCPNCSRDIPEDVRFCPYCGVEFVDGEEEERVYVTPEPQGARADFDVTPPGAERQTSKKQKKAQYVVAACVIVSAVLVLTVASVAFMRGKREYVTDEAGEKILIGSGIAEMQVTDENNENRKIKADTSLIKKDDVLKEYTAVMNKLKTDAPAFTKINYQNLPTEHQSFGGIGGIVLPIIERNVSSKEKAKSESVPQGNADKLPLYNSRFGCLLNDVTKIKGCYCEVLDDGSSRLVIVLQDEKNPKPLPSGAEHSDDIVNAVFPPHNVGEIMSSVGSLALSDIEFLYKSTTVVLRYDRKTKKPKEIKYTLNMDVSAKTLLGTVSMRVVDNTEFYGFIYNN